MNEGFATSLELLTDDGSYNYLAYLLADENGISIKVALGGRDGHRGIGEVDVVQRQRRGLAASQPQIAHQACGDGDNDGPRAPVGRRQGQTETPKGPFRRHPCSWDETQRPPTTP